MSETQPTFKPVLANESNQSGNLTIVRPSKLAETGFIGEVAQGIYEGSVPNKFNEKKRDYLIRAANGDLTIINGTGSLDKQMGMVQPGSLVLIEYGGKATINKGKLKGKSVHRFTVSVA